MEEKTELNDIILNKGSNSGGGSKKILLAVAVLAIILIIVIVLMNSLKSEGTDNLPQPVLPPEPTPSAQIAKEDPLFEPVEVIEEASDSDQNLEKIAEKLKQESMNESSDEEVMAVDKVEPEVIEPVVVNKPEPARPAPEVKKTAPKAVASGNYFIQVGSFSKSAPNKAFLKRITDNGYAYAFREVQRPNRVTIIKVLVGPFEDEAAARKALKVIRQKVESGAFLTKG